MINNQPSDNQASGPPLSSFTSTGMVLTAADGIAIGPQTWTEALPLLIALLRDANSTGQHYAAEQLKRMAHVADMSLAVYGALGEFVTADSSSASQASQASAPAPRDERTADLFETPVDGPACQANAGDATTPLRFGHLALQQGGKRLPLEVLYSAAGFYLGTLFEGTPYSRESQYFRRREEAATALREGTWDQCDKPLLGGDS